jgi:hypothetical protein
MEEIQGHRLQSRAMQVSYNISTWTARKYDKKVSKEVDDAHETERQAGRFNKILIDLSALKEMNRHAAGTRQYILDNSAAWLNKGTRIITPEIYFDFTKEIRMRKEKFWDLYHEFEPKYPDLRAAARFELKDMFNIEDYPHPDLLRTKFGFEITITPIPTLDLLKDLRTGLGDDEIKKIEAETEERMATMFNRGVIELYDRLDVVVEHLVEKLSTYSEGSRIHKTLITNIIGMVDLAGKLNYTKDPQLETIRRNMERTLATYDTEDFKKLPEVRTSAIMDARAVRKDINAAKTALQNPDSASKKVDSIVDQMSSYM